MCRPANRPKELRVSVSCCRGCWFGCNARPPGRIFNVCIFRAKAPLLGQCTVLHMCATKHDCFRSILLCCRACGHICSSSQSCVAGSCQSSQCATGEPRVPCWSGGDSTRRVCARHYSSAVMNAFQLSCHSMVSKPSLVELEQTLFLHRQTCRRPHMLPCGLPVPSGHMRQLPDGQQQLVRGWLIAAKRGGASAPAANLSPTLEGYTLQARMTRTRQA